MKKPEIDLSKEGMSKFFLHHTEKVILGVAIAALGYLCWNGWSTEKYTKTEPKKLSELATRAKQHIDQGDSWTKIEKFRVADDTAHIRIEEAKNRQLDPSKYAIGRLLGIKTASLGLRPDPELVKPEDLVAVSYRAPFLLKRRDDYEAPLSKLPLATAAEGGNQRDKDDRRGDLGGSGEIGSEGDSDGASKKKDENKDDFGDTVPPVMEQELVGVRPKGPGGDVDYDPFVFDGIAVTGLVNFDAQFKKYEAAFKESIGYFPLRDRPRYLYLEVQRREVGTEDWVDISEQFVDNRYGGEQAPEIIDPLNYDPVLTRDIPPLVNYDYRQLARHEKIGLRKLVPSALAKRNEVENEKTSDLDGIFDNDVNFRNEANTNRDKDRERDGGNPGGNRDNNKDDSGEDDFEVMKGSSRTIYDAINPLATPKTEYKLIRFFDYRASVGKTYQYRVRLWLNDPNDPEGFTKAGEGGRRNGIDDKMKGSSAEMSAGNEGEKSNGVEDDEITALGKYPYVELNKNLQQQDVRSRIREKRSTDMVPSFVFVGKEDEQKTAKQELDDLLSVAWSTEWSEPTPPVTVGSNPADFYAGDVIRSTVIRNTDENAEFPRDEPSANLVTALWSKQYHTAIPSLKAVRRADVLNYSVPKAHILHPAEGTVRRLKDAEIETDAVVVDLMGGGNVPGRFKFPVKLPSEVLVMDGSGKMRLQNSEDDLLGYRHSLFLPDEGNEYGRAKRKKDNDGGRNDDGGLPDF